MLDRKLWCDVCSGVQQLFCRGTFLFLKSEAENHISQIVDSTTRLWAMDTGLVKVQSKNLNSQLLTVYNTFKKSLWINSFD